jgi:hypothetical protein
MAIGSLEVGGIHYTLDLDDKQFQKKASGASKEVSSMSKHFESAANASKVFTTAIIGLGAGLVAYGIKGVKAYNIQARAEAELIQLHHKNTGATMEQTQELFNLASQVQSYGVIGDEAIIMGQSQLATFKLSTDSIKSLTPAMADMVAKQKGVNATGEDFVNIGNLVGKVMEGNIGALGRYGVSFSEADEKILKHGSETEKAAKLAEVLAQNYGGVNEALRNTFEGQMKAAQNTIGDFHEIVGKLITERLAPVIKSFNDWLDSIGGPQGAMDLLTKKLQELEPFIPVIAGAIITAMVPAFVAWGIAAAPIILWTTALLLIGAALGALIKFIIDRFGGWNNVMKIFTDFINNHARPAWEKLVGFWNNSLQPAIMTIWGIFKDNILPIFAELWGYIMQQLMPAWNAFRESVLENEKVQLQFKVMLAAVIAVIGLAIAIVIAFVGGIMALALVVLTVIEELAVWEKKVDEVKQAIKDFIVSGIDWLISKLNELVNFVFKINIELPSVGEMVQKAKDIKQGIINALKGSIGIDVNASKSGSLLSNTGSSKGGAGIGTETLATGGIVTSPTRALIGEGGEAEAVIPLSKLDSMMKGSGTNIIINNPVVTDDFTRQSLIDDIVRAINRQDELMGLGNNT